MNKITKNYIYNLAYQILTIVVPLITTPYVARVLGAEGVGTFSYTYSIVQYFILIGCVGLNLYGQREIAYVQHQKDKRSYTFFELVILRSMTISIALLIYYLNLCNSNAYSFIFKIMTIDIMASIFDISWFFQGIEDFKKIVTRNIIVKLVGVILIFVFVKSEVDLNIYILCHSLTSLLGNLSMWIYIPNLVESINIKRLMICKHIKPALILFFPQIATSVYTILDKTMIGFLTGSTVEVAYYEQGQKIIKIALTVVTSLGTVMMPRIANLYKQNKTEEIKKHLFNSIRFTCILSFPMMLGIGAISKNLVPWFFGGGYDKVVPNMIIISPVIVFIAFGSLFGTQYLLPTGRQKAYTFSLIAGTISNFMLNLFLIPKLASLGAAFATVTAEMIVTSIQIYSVRNEFKISKIVKENIHYLIASIIMFIPVLLLSEFLYSNIFNTFLVVIIGIVIYFFILRKIFKDDMIKSFIKIVIKK